IHSAFLRCLSCWLFGLDYPWYLQAGVAGQYALGTMFQPSVFGVGLVLAIGSFLYGQPYFAAGLVGVVVAEHFTYALPGALLTAGFLVALAVQRRYREAAVVGGLTLALTLPVVVGGLTLALTLPVAVFQWWRFQPT